MSQQGILNVAGGGGSGSPILYVEGNTGGVVPPTANLVHIVGDGTTIEVTGNPGTSTLTISEIGPASAETLTGNTGGPIAPVAGNINTVGTGSITIAGAGNTLTTELTGLTNHAVLVGAGTATITNVGPGTTNTVLLGNTGADPSFGAVPNAALVNDTITVTSTGSTVTITGSPVALGGTVNLEVVGAGSDIHTLTGNSGGAISPTAFNINTLGTGSITIVGSGSTLTTELTGLTAHNVLLGEGTATVGLAAPTATAGVPLVSNGSSTDPSFSTASVPGGGTGNVTFTAYSLIAAGATPTGAFQNVVGTGTTGQLLVSAGSAALPAWTTVATGVSSVTGTANQILASPTTGAVGLSLIGPYTPSTYTAHSVLVGEGTSSIVGIGPSATTGQIFQNNAGADPSFSTATYPSTTTVNQILYSSAANVVGGLATVNNGVLITSAAGVPSLLADGTTGQVLTATTGSPPAWATPPGITTVTRQVFTSSGTYTPTAGMVKCDIEVVGGGGGGGSTTVANASQNGAAGGGGGGGYARGIFSAATIGASQTVTIGSAGTAGTAGGNGGTGGTSSVGVLITATGGLGGQVGNPQVGTSSAAGGAGGAGTLGDFQTSGTPGTYGFSSFITTGFTYSSSGAGGSSFFGGGGVGITLINSASSSAGTTAQSYGGGGAGASAGPTGVAANGGAGFKGIVIITEYI